MPKVEIANNLKSPLQGSKKVRSLWSLLLIENENQGCWALGSLFSEPSASDL